jgi:hypothetical protein
VEVDNASVLAIPFWDDTGAVGAGMFAAYGILVAAGPGQNRKVIKLTRAQARQWERTKQSRFGGTRKSKDSQTRSRPEGREDVAEATTKYML